jgi:hypothetical protein
LSSSLQSVSAQFQIVLLMDTARAHLGLEVFRRAAELNIWVIIFHAGLTWLLQPLDVCCFGSFKRHLKDEYCRARSAKGKVTAPEWLVLMIQAAVWLGWRSWTLAFQLTGITGQGQQRLHRELRHICASLPAVPPGCPSNLEVARLCPSNSRAVHWWHLMRGPGRFRCTIRLAQRVHGLACAWRAA